LENLQIDGRIILNLTRKKFGGRLWTGFIGFRKIRATWRVNILAEKLLAFEEDVSFYRFLCGPREQRKA
jgi:hypothetical protein